MQVWSLVRELRSHMPCGGAKPKPNQNKKHCIWYIYIYISMLLLLSYFSRVWLCVTQRRQPTRLPYPWDSPGKNTGVDCHFLLQCMKVKSESEVSQSCPTSRPHGLQPTRLLCPWDFPGKSTGVGCHHLLQWTQSITNFSNRYIFPKSSISNTDWHGN